MRLHRFYINTPVGENRPQVAEQSSLRGRQLTIYNQQLIHQWRDVFRYGAGDSVILFDGSGDDYICEIITLDKKEAEVKIIEKKKGIVPDREVWLFFSLIKKDNAETILQKCTELGVSYFVPVISGRSEKKGLNTERARKILIEASEQCGRSDVPELSDVMPLEKAIEKYGKEIKFVAFDSGGANYKLLPTTYPLCLIVGPEGGWNEGELALFKEKNIPVYSLGSLTLRAETAAIVAICKVLG